MSKDVKKYLCIKGCLPVNSKIGNSSKASKMAKNSKKNDKKTELNKATDGNSLHGLPLMDEERLNHTRRWVQNVSTQANYDPEATLVEDCRMDEVKFDDSAILDNDSCFKMHPEDTRVDDSLVSSSTTGQSRHRRKHKARDNAVRDNSMRSNSDCTSMSSSCVSLATEVVTLNVEDCRSLGITIVGHTNGPQGDCGIFVGCVKKGGVAEMSGRIEPGDLILEVNSIDLEKMSNDKALAILKSEVSKGGLVRVTLAKYWDMEDLKGNESQFYGGIEPIYEPAYSSLSGPLLPPPNLLSKHPSRNSFRSFPDFHPPFHHPPSIHTSFHASYPPTPSFLPDMRRPFLGSELVDWIQENIAGMRARNEARSYAQSMLNNGFISSINARFHEDGWYAVVDNHSPASSNRHFF